MRGELVRYSNAFVKHSRTSCSCIDVVQCIRNVTIKREQITLSSIDFKSSFESKSYLKTFINWIGNMHLNIILNRFNHTIVYEIDNKYFAIQKQMKYERQMNYLNSNVHNSIRHSTFDIRHSSFWFMFKLIIMINHISIHIKQKQM